MAKIKKTVIFMGYTCNNNCIFCCNSDRRKFIKDKNTDEIKKDIIISKKQGSRYLELIGGEPTIRKDIFEIISFAKKLDFDTIMFATNGRMLSNKEFAKKVIDKGVNHIVFSIHGHKPELHDSLTQVPGSFNQLIKGINNLKELGFGSIGSNTTITNQNYKHVLDIGKKIYDLGIKNSEFIFVDPTHGAPKNNFYELVPTYEEASPYINSLLGFGKEKRIKHWHIRYLPLCFVDEKYHDRISEIKEGSAFHTTHLAPDFVNEDVGKSRKEVSRTKIAECKNCKYGNVCEGYWKEYVLNYLGKNKEPPNTYKNFFKDLKKMFKNKHKKIEKIENQFFNLLNKDLLNKIKPLEYSIKIDKESFNCLRFIFFSHDKIENNQIITDRFIKKVFNGNISKLHQYFKKYALGFDVKESSTIKKYYFWVEDGIDKGKAFREFSKLHNIKKKLFFPLKDLEIISIKKSKNKVNYNFYSTFKEDDKNEISRILNKKIPKQILQKENKQETSLLLYSLSKEDKIKVLSQNIFLYYFIKKNKPFFVNNGLSISYLTYSDDSLKFYFKVGAKSKLPLNNLASSPNYPDLLQIK